MKTENHFVGFLKFFIPIFVSIFAGCFAWAFTMEQRTARVEIRQVDMQDSVNDIKTDIHDIKQLIIDQLKKKDD